MAIYVIYGIKDTDNDYSVVDMLEAKSKKQAIENFFLYSNASNYVARSGIYAKKVKLAK